MNQDVETLRMLAAWFDVVYPELTRDGRPLANTSDEIQQDLRRIADMLEQGFVAGKLIKIEEASESEKSKLIAEFDQVYRYTYANTIYRMLRKIEELQDDLANCAAGPWKPISESPMFMTLDGDFLVEDSKGDHHFKKYVCNSGDDDITHFARVNPLPEAGK